VTPQGRRLLHAVVSGLDHIATIVDELRRPAGPAQVSITTTIALASVWLMPRVAAFRAIHPEIDLRIIAADPIMDLAAEGIDLGIRYGMGQWPGITAQPLFHIDLFPVCSPSYLERHTRPRNPHDLLSATLLHIDEPNSQDADWAVWFAAMGMVTPPFAGGLHFNNYPLLIQAALNGQGIGLGWGHIVDDLIKSGALVRPIDSMRRLKPAFYLVVPTDNAVREAAQIFHDWLLADTAPLRATESRGAPRFVTA
jgi:DNA-binding transcriptional LysR family regulator